MSVEGCVPLEAPKKVCFYSVNFFSILRSLFLCFIVLAQLLLVVFLLLFSTLLYPLHFGLYARLFEVIDEVPQPTISHTNEQDLVIPKRLELLLV